MITTSHPLACAASRASYTTAPGSEPSACLTISAPALSVHTCNWSIAAARKVSAAATRTFLPSFLNWLLSLPMVVVLPAPFTPITMITAGDTLRSSPVSSPIISDTTSWISAIISCGSVMPLSFIFLRSWSHISSEVSTPISLIIICSSSCSKSSSSISVKELSILWIPPKRKSLVLLSPSAIFFIMPIYYLQFNELSH